MAEKVTEDRAEFVELLIAKADAANLDEQAAKLRRFKENLAFVTEFNSNDCSLNSGAGLAADLAFLLGCTAAMTF